MQVHFHNVAVSLEADTPKEAYTKLCNALAVLGHVEWATDTFSIETDKGLTAERSTVELFPGYAGGPTT